MAEASLVETLACYVPGMVLDRIANTPGINESPAMEHFDCAIVFADISGFTGLTERLATRGPVGTETLSHILNHYFDTLIDIVYAHGGDVINFAGDALLAAWRPAETEKDLHQASLRAAACALDIQQNLEGYNSPEDDISLECKVAIGAGPASLMHIGGVLGRWETLIGGPPLIQVRQLTDRAGAGDILVSAQAADELGDKAQTSRISSQILRLESLHQAPTPHIPRHPDIQDEMQEHLRGYLPAAILYRLTANQSDWLGELRRISVLFINLPDLHHDASLAQSQKIMCMLQNAVYRYEGSINKLSVDDKGITLICALGLPPLAHEDDPNRALQVAFAIHEELSREGQSCSIGITTGRAFAGSMGNKRRREYGIIGDVVNTAARLMQHADGHILCDKATWASTKHQIEFSDSVDLELKGKLSYVQAHGPIKNKLQRQEPVASRTELIDRVHERSSFHKHLGQLLQARKGGTIILEGEPGIGKSRLVEYLLTVSRELGTTVYYGTCDPVERNTTLYIWRSVLSAILEQELNEDNHDAIRDALIKRLSPHESLLKLAPLLNELLSLNLPENDFTRVMNGEIRQANIHYLIVQLLQQTVQQQAVVLVLEDLHWMDSSSWSLILKVCREVDPILMVMAHRPFGTHAPEEYQALFSDGNIEHLCLEPLSKEDSLKLIESCIGVDSLPKPIADFIQTRSEGHPLFTEELTNALIESGSLLKRKGTCELSPGIIDLSNISLPETIEGIITSRVDKLTPEQQFTLKVASVIGREFSLTMLGEIHPLNQDETTLLDDLKSITEQGFILPQTENGEATYVFKHAVIQQVGYEMLLYAQRQTLHRTVAEWIEAHSPKENLPYPALAHHWGHAGDSAKAIDYLEHAALQAERNHANAELIGFLQEAAKHTLELDTEIPVLRRAMWARLQGEAERALGHASRAQSHLEHALSLLDYPVPQTQNALWLGIARQLSTQILRRFHLCPKSKLPPSERKRRKEAAAALERLVPVHYFSNDDTRLFYSCVAAVNMAESVPDIAKKELAMSYGNIAFIAVATGAAEQARHYGKLSINEADRTGLPQVITWSQFLVSATEASRGEWESAISRIEKNINLAEQVGDSRRLDELRATLGVITGFIGQPEKGRDCFSSAYQSARQRNDAQIQGWTLMGWARTLHTLGMEDNLNELMQYARQLITTEDDNTDQLTYFDYHTLRCDLHLRHSRIYEAMHELEEAIRSAQALGRPRHYYLLQVYRHLAKLCIQLQSLKHEAVNDELIHSWTQSAVLLMRKYARTFPIGAPALHYILGLQAWMNGKDRQAVKAWRKSLHYAERLNMPQEQAQTCRALSHALQHDREQANALQQRYQSLMSNMGIYSDLHSVDMFEAS